MCGRDEGDSHRRTFPSPEDRIHRRIFPRFEIADIVEFCDNMLPCLWRYFEVTHADKERWASSNVPEV